MHDTVETRVRYEAWLSGNTAPTGDDLDALSVAIADELERVRVVDPSIMWDANEGWITFAFAEPSDDTGARAAIQRVMLAAGLATPGEDATRQPDLSWRITRDRFSLSHSWDGAALAI